MVRQSIPTVKNPIFPSKLKFENSKLLLLIKVLTDRSLKIEISNIGIAIDRSSKEYNNKLN